MVPLEANHLFREVSADQLETLRAATRVLAIPAGTVIFKEGDQGDGVYVVLEGAVRISAVIAEGEPRTLTQIAAGDFFGEMAVVDNEPRSATAVAEADSELGFVPRGEMLAMLERSPRLAINLMREFSLRIRDFNRRYILEVLQADRLSLVGRFARSIVHDFKNPLHIIGISAEMAAMEVATPVMREAAKNRIRKQVDRLSNMINELLEFTRGSQVSVVLAETDYATYVRHIVEDLRGEVAVKNVNLQLENPPPAVKVLIDPARMTHVFYNLVNNAVDAMAPEGGRITLRFRVLDHEVVTEVQDTGRGIAPEIADRLFEAFATYGKAQGTGLGLSICRRILEDHGGRIQARTEPGGGAVFSFALPRR